jgi:hypothetical protein
MPNFLLNEQEIVEGETPATFVISLTVTVNGNSLYAHVFIRRPKNYTGL